MPCISYSERPASSPITLTAQFLARGRWMSMPNHSANAAKERVLGWGLHGSAPMLARRLSAISAEAVSSTIRLMGTPLTWRRGWKSPRLILHTPVEFLRLEDLLAVGKSHHARPRGSRYHFRLR